MASRTKLAAAACVLASGLLAGGSCASLAFAVPDPGQGGDTTGAASNGTPGGATGQPSGTPAADPTTAAPKTDVSAPQGPSGTPEKPVAQVGDGRNGGVTGETTAPTEPSLPSKHPETEVVIPPQTAPGSAGEQPGGAGTPPVGVVSETDAMVASEALPTGTTTEPTIDPTVEPELVPAPEDVAKTLAGDEEEQHPGWPFPCWWPIPNPGNLPGGGGGGGGGGLPIERLAPVPPLMQLPIPLTLPSELLAGLPSLSLDPIVDAVNGLATAASQLPFMQISLPVIVLPPLGVPTAGTGDGDGGGGAGAGGAGGPGVGPHSGVAVPPPVTGNSGGKPATPPPVEPKPSDPPAFSAGSGSAPAPSYRAGYVDYLRAAGLGEVAAVAVPGLTGILVLTGAGGLLGYRQARAGHTVRASGTGRFMG